MDRRRSPDMGAREVEPVCGRPTSWDSLPLALDVEQAAEVLGIGRNSCYALVARGELSVVRVGRRLIVPRQALENFLMAAAANGLPGSNAETDL